MPYAILCFALFPLATFRIPAPIVFANSPLSAGDVTVRPEPAAALLVPLIVAAVLAVIGSQFAADAKQSPRVVGALAGGLRMFLVASVLAILGGVIVLGQRPDLRETIAGLSERVYGYRLSAETAAVNSATWVLVPSMGACDAVHGLSAETLDLVCYQSFPQAGGTFGRAPAPYYLFLLVPAIAALLGGARAGRRADARTQKGAVGIGALAGIVFAVIVAFASAASSIVVSGVIAGRTFSFSAGPDVVSGALLALAWGCAGGAIGGAIGGRVTFEDGETLAA